jgi:hypothetical protein
MFQTLGIIIAVIIQRPRTRPMRAEMPVLSKPIVLMMHSFATGGGPDLPVHQPVRCK